MPTPYEQPVRVICGHYGSGKTEFSVSLAMAEARSGHPVAIADLDIVNPYFRSRERADLMEAAGVRVISSMLGHEAAIEIPAISPEVRAPLGDPTIEVILDMGGDATGAKVLAQFHHEVTEREHQLLMVVNAYRPETGTVDAVNRYIDSMEAACGLMTTGLISNTHLLRETSTDDVRRGLDLCRQVSAARGVPIAFVSAIPDALAGLRPDETEARRLPVGMYLRDEWM